MASLVYLASAGVTLALAVIVFVAMARGRDWQNYSPQIGAPRPSGLSRLTDSVRVWTLGFILLVLATTAAILAALQGGSVTAMLAIFGVVVLGFLTFSVYAMGRSRGHPHAAAVGEAVIGLGFIVLVAVGGRLLLDFGAA
jgi:hypothetical protein